MKDHKRFLEIGLLAAWAMAFAFFFGQLVWYVTPFSWPFSVITGYLVGAISGAILAWLLINRVRSVAVRATLAIVSLIFMGAISITVGRLTSQTSIMRAEIQELRDNQQQSLQE